jgi:cysteinyl-tRNA synthetase
MSMKYLDATLDIHMGGEDHLFPHHENEIAQSEAATSQKFARYWLHSRFILIDNEKMSKSKGNIFTLDDLRVKGFAPLVYRFLIISGHYRSRLNFTWEALADARQKLNRLIEFKKRLGKISSDAAGPSPAALIVEKTSTAFKAAMDDDLNTPKALDAIFEMIKEINRLADQQALRLTEAKQALAALRNFDRVLSILDYQPLGLKISEIQIEQLLTERRAARQTKDFARADAIRQELLSQGIAIKDTPLGTEWRKQ